MTEPGLLATSADGVVVVFAVGWEIVSCRQSSLPHSSNSASPPQNIIIIKKKKEKKDVRRLAWPERAHAHVFG